MTRLSPLLALPLLAACVGGDPDEGTSVGNPGRFAMTVASGTGVTFSGGSVPVDEMMLSACGDDGEDESLVADDTIELGAEIDLPAGAWCSLEMTLSEPLELDFAIDSVAGREYLLELDADALEVVPSGGAGFAVGEDQAFLLELGAPAWLDAEDLELDDEDNLVEDPDLLVDLATAVTDQSALFDDADADGDVDPEERDAGAVATSGDDDGGDSGTVTGGSRS